MFTELLMPTQVDMRPRYVYQRSSLRQRYCQVYLWCVAIKNSIDVVFSLQYSNHHPTFAHLKPLL